QIGKPASVTISNGAKINVKADSINQNPYTKPGSVYINNSELLVTGIDSSLSTEGNVVLVTDGKLSVNNGAELIAKQIQTAINTNDSFGNSSIVVENKSSITSEMINLAGNDNSLSVTSGGKVTTNRLLSTAKGSIIKVDGPDSVLSSSGQLAFGRAGGTSLLVLSNGGVLQHTTSATNGIVMADPNGGKANLVIGGVNDNAPDAPGSILAKKIEFKGNTADSSEIKFNHTSNNYDFSTPITGTGTLLFVNGVTNLSGDNSAMSGKVDVGTDSTLNVMENNALGGSDVSIDTGGKLSLRNSGAFIFNGNVNNNGILELSDSKTYGSVVTVKGDYSGTDGSLAFNGKLSDDGSIIDKLEILGNYNGSTHVIVNNIGGLGAETIDGITLIGVTGNVNGSFNQKGRIVAGAYDYNLIRGSGSDANRWYLTSEISPLPPVPDTPAPLPPVPDTPAPLPPVPDTPAPRPDTQKIRPEAGSYIANSYLTNTMFLSSFQDRATETEYVDTVSGETRSTSMWLRNEGGHNKFKDSTGQLSTQSNRYVLQIGGDVMQWSANGIDKFRVGIMAGYGNNHSNTNSSVTDYSAKSSINGYNTGIYGNWLQNYKEKNGWYVDSWLQYNWFDNTINGEGVAEEKYTSRGITASIESGYSFKLSQDERTSYWLKPNAQFVLMDVRSKDFNEKNGTKISFDDSGNIMSRVGVKAFMKGHSAIDDSNSRVFEPYTEVNWIHNTNDFGISMNGVGINQAGLRNILETKIGVNGQLTDKLNVWGDITQQFGTKSFSDTQATLGVKYSF
ncbi:TPA: autotransporter outer membrane beta-barrel domain-containing protein, partial [Morganella morganii]|nr:autotransporter outer membrane beta-barrel domain-containing protein [Morganella morganii]